MSTALELYGTDRPPAKIEKISVGKLAFSLQDGALRHITYDGVELLRGIAFLVRDRDWGTLAPRLTEISRDTANGFALSQRMEYESHGAKLDVTVEVRADASGLTVSARGSADALFETNRTGFTILHPAGVSGCPAVVGHSDGSVEEASFPVIIDPWQPFMDIVSLAHERDGYRVRCELSGDTFEMEDQRQWGDASFKTYNRPLALPWPYELQAGETVEQSVRLTWEACETEASEATDEVSDATFPEMALVITAEDASRLAGSPQDIAKVAPQRLLCHIDAALGGIEGQIAAFAALQKALPSLVYDAELIGTYEPSVAEELTAMKAAMNASGFKPDSVLVCPSVDRQSTPPGSEWPECPPLDLIHETSAEVFPDITRGGGMVSFFPELNRKRPPLEHLSFVSHGLCPIVHAADDVSVMETLEVIPHITRSARAIIGDLDYRIGPATIAMRQNPYGNRTIPNPDNDRVCMAHDDPRHRAKFGAAYVIGLAASLAPAGVTVWAPSAVYGPRGLDGPIVDVLAALARCAGQMVHRVEVANGIATLEVGGTKFTVNLTPEPNGDLGPYDWAQSNLADAGGNDL